MSRHEQKKSKRGREIKRVWTHAEAQAALPYIKSVVQSIREHWLEARQWRREVQRLASKPGRADRATLIAQQEKVHEAELAESRCELAVEEIQDLDIYCIDPVRGETLIPFVQEEQLAWFVFDPFDPEPLRSWRFHSDPLDSRRPVTDALLTLPHSASPVV